MSTAAAGGLPLVQRYELAASLCAGLRVLDLSDAPSAARSALEVCAKAVVVAGPEDAPQRPFDVTLALDGLVDAERREQVLAEIERRAGDGTRVLVALERPAGRPRSPRTDPPVDEVARTLAACVPGARVIPQFVAEGSFIGPPPREPDGSPELDVRLPEPREEDAAALIVVSGYDDGSVEQARVSLRVAAAPVLLSYVRELELANAELLRANRALMRGSFGRDGSAAASLAHAQHQAEQMKALARFHEEHARRVEAWYDAPRYHLADRVRETLVRIPGLTRFVRFMWSLISTRAETPHIDAAANPPPEDEGGEPRDVASQGEEPTNPEPAREPEEVSSRLEE
jgi:hypothetical protein